ncbi:MAG: hypothetical protein DWG76_04840 [Chloroflexi bacterium]|nr:hypothetical protein [Chloroflexota bacterium]
MVGLEVLVGAGVGVSVAVGGDVRVALAAGIEVGVGAEAGLQAANEIARINKVRLSERSMAGFYRLQINSDL